MKIFFVRHGEADGDLVYYGIKQIEKSADFLKQQEMTPPIRLITSIVMRAVSSAKIIQETLGLSESIQVGWLVNEDGANIAKHIMDFSEVVPPFQTIIAVSHQPEIKETTSYFAKIFGVNFHTRAKNGSVHLVDTEAKTVQTLFEPD